MNLFEATKLLKSVGYNVGRKSDRWAQMDRLVESIVRGVTSPMLNEMGMRTNLKSQGKELSPLGSAACKIIDNLASYNTAASRTKRGDNVGDKAGEYVADWEAFKDFYEGQDPDEHLPGDTAVYTKMTRDGYDQAIYNDDLNMIKVANSTHGAKGGMDFNAAIAAGDLARAYQCLKNSATSGGSQVAIDGMKAKLAKLRKVKGAKSGEMKAKIDQLAAKIEALEPSTRSGRNADSYTVTFDPSKARVIGVVFNKSKIDAQIGDGTATFSTTPSRAEAVIASLERFGAEVVKNERPVAARSTEKTTETISVSGDDMDIVDLILGDNKNITYEDNGDGTVSITGTKLQIDRAIADLEANGVEV